MNQESEKKRRRTHDEWMQYAANVVTALGGLGAAATLFSGKLIWVVPAALAVFFTVYSLRNHRVKSAAFGLSVVVLAVVASVIGLTQHGAPSATPQRPSVAGNVSDRPAPSTSSSSSASIADSTTKASDTPKVILDTDSITLSRSQGVDVDQPNQTPVDAQGATGALDLYFDPGGLPGRVYAHDAESVFGASSSTTDHYATCVDQFDPRSSDRNTQPYAAADVGSGFCFKTSDGHMAWMGVVAVNDPVPSQSAMGVTLHVIVWDKAAP